MEITYNTAQRAWTHTNADVMVIAEGVVRDRESIRCTVSVYKNGHDGPPALIARDKISLTGQRSRAKFAKDSKEAGCEIDEKVLLAFDEAIRVAPSGLTVTTAPESSPDGEWVFTGKVATFEEYKHFIQGWLELEDTDAVSIVLGSLKAHDLGGIPSWLLIVAAPSSLKTELVRLTEDLEGVYAISKLTPHTLASGLDVKGEEPSLLARLNSEIMAFKDFTTILEMPFEARQAILAQLREIFDGKYDDTWGTGKELHWKGRLGFLAGVTPVIDKAHAVMAILGPRFLLLRLAPESRPGSAKKAIENEESKSDDSMRQELRAATATFLAGIPAVPVKAPKVFKDWLAAVADFTTRARSAVVRDGSRRELEYAPEPEGPARFAKQLFALLQGITLVHGKEQPTETELKLIARVAVDCIPFVRWKVIRALRDANGPLASPTVATRAQLPPTTTARTLEDLQALKIIERLEEKKGSANQFQMLPEHRDAALLFDTFPEAGVPMLPAEEKAKQNGVGNAADFPPLDTQQTGADVPGPVHEPAALKGDDEVRL